MVETKAITLGDKIPKSVRKGNGLARHALETSKKVFFANNKLTARSSGRT